VKVVESASVQQKALMQDRYPDLPTLGLWMADSASFLESPLLRVWVLEGCENQGCLAEE
jgi:hypothetical protein